MSYTVIAVAFILFLSSMFLHVVIWRLFKPKRLVRALIILLIVLPCALVFLIIFSTHTPVPGFLNAHWLGVLLMHLSLASAYILSYPAIQAKCPSLTMLLLIEDSGRDGSTLEELSLAFTDESLRDSRLDDLVDDSMVVIRGEDYHMTFKGAIFLWPLMMLRRLLGLPSGEG